MKPSLRSAPRLACFRFSDGSVRSALYMQSTEHYRDSFDRSDNRHPAAGDGPMLKNRSVPPCTVIPVLYYPDPSEAAEWLCKAFGFKVRLRIGKNHRIQMKAGDGCLVVAEGTLPALKTEAKVAGGHAVMIRVDDALAHCDRARSAGARIQ